MTIVSCLARMMAPRAVLIAAVGPASVPEEGARTQTAEAADMLSGLPRLGPEARLLLRSDVLLALDDEQVT